MRMCIMWEDICSASAVDEKLYSSWRRGSSLSDMSVYTDDAGVSAASLLSSVVVMLDRDERSKLIEGGVDIPVPCWPYSFVVSSTNLYASSFTFKS